MTSGASVFSLLKLTIYQFVGEGKVVLADCRGQMCINELEEDIEDDIAFKSFLINDLLLIYNETSPNNLLHKHHIKVLTIVIMGTLSSHCQTFYLCARELLNSACKWKKAVHSQESLGFLNTNCVFWRATKTSNEKEITVASWYCRNLHSLVRLCCGVAIVQCPVNLLYLRHLVIKTIHITKKLTRL